MLELLFLLISCEKCNETYPEFTQEELEIIPFAKIGDSLTFINIQSKVKATYYITQRGFEKGANAARKYNECASLENEGYYAIALEKKHSPIWK